MTTETTVEALQGYASAQALNVPEQFIEALRASQAITAANEALAQAPHASLGVAALPAEFNLHDLEPYLPLRRRARGTFATQFVAPFAQYTHAHAGDGASVFVNAQEMSATAVLDLGTPHAPGHGDNKARLQLQRTAAFQALMAIADKGQRQAQVAEFLEDWAPHATLQLFDADNKEVPLRQAVAAVRRVTIETARKVESDVQQLSERQGWAFMQILKMVRGATTARNGLHNADDALDGAAYAALGGEAAAMAAREARA